MHWTTHLPSLDSRWINVDEKRRKAENINTQQIGVKRTSWLPIRHLDDQVLQECSNRQHQPVNSTSPAIAGTRKFQNKVSYILSVCPHSHKEKCQKQSASPAPQSWMSVVFSSATNILRICNSTSRNLLDNYFFIPLNFYTQGATR